MAKVKKDDERFANAYGTDMTVQVQKGGKGSIKVVRPSKDTAGKDTAADSMTYTDQDLRIVGEGFEDGEVVLNFDSLDGQSMNTRISAQAVDGKFRAIPPMFGWAGTWTITAYQPMEDASSSKTPQRIMNMVDHGISAYGRCQQQQDAPAHYEHGRSGQDHSRKAWGLMGNSVDELNRKSREEYEASKGMTTGSVGGSAAEVHVVDVPEPEPEPTPEPEPEPEEAA